MAEQQVPQTEVTVTYNNSAKVVHFSDGTEECELEEEIASNYSELPEQDVDAKALPWGPWLSYYAWKSGTKVLNAVDYAGETLAEFFGITTPKYQIEINEYERIQVHNRKVEEESIGWVPKDSIDDIHLVVTEPTNCDGSFTQRLQNDT